MARVTELESRAEAQIRFSDCKTSDLSTRSLSFTHMKDNMVTAS